MYQTQTRSAVSAEDCEDVHECTVYVYLKEEGCVCVCVCVYEVEPTRMVVKKES